MRVNCREGFRRLCLIVSSLIGLCVAVIAWTMFPSGYMKSFSYYTQNESSYGGERYKAYQELKRRLAAKVNQGYVREETARDVLDKVVRQEEGAGDQWQLLMQNSTVIVPMWERINWSSIAWFFALSSVAIGLPWFLYGVGLYIARGFIR